jgi:hypothetical protein
MASSASSPGGSAAAETIGPLSPFQKITGIHFSSKSTTEGLLTCTFSFSGGEKLVGGTNYFPPDSSPADATQSTDTTFVQGQAPELLFYLVAESSPGKIIQRQGPIPMNIGVQTIITSTILKGPGTGQTETQVTNGPGQPLPFEFTMSLVDVPDTANVSVVVTSGDEELYPAAFLPGYTASARDEVTTTVNGKNPKVQTKTIPSYTLTQFHSGIDDSVPSTGWWAFPVQFNWQLSIIAFGLIASPTPPLE